MLPDSIGYIKLSQFAITSHNELITALNNLKAQGMKRLIFDLRGQSRRFPRPGNPHRQRIPAGRQADRLYRRPKPQPHG